MLAINFIICLLMCYEIIIVLFYSLYFILKLILHFLVLFLQFLLLLLLNNSQIRLMLPSEGQYFCFGSREGVNS